MPKSLDEVLVKLFHGTSTFQDNMHTLCSRTESDIVIPRGFRLQSCGDRSLSRNETACRRIRQSFCKICHTSRVASEGTPKVSCVHRLVEVQSYLWHMIAKSWQSHSAHTAATGCCFMASTPLFASVIGSGFCSVFAGIQESSGSFDDGIPIDLSMLFQNPRGIVTLDVGASNTDCLN